LTTKQLHASIDFYDELIRAGRFYEPEHFDQLLDYLRDIGVSRVEWIYDTVWDLYRRPVGDAPNALAYVAQAAERRGIECYATIKIFERTLFGPRTLFPHTFPAPEAERWFDDMRGRVTAIDPLAAAHPEYRFARRPGQWDPPGRVRPIKLVKQDAALTRVRPERLALWTGPHNGRLERYEGLVEFGETIEWRQAFPGGGTGLLLARPGVVPAVSRATRPSRSARLCGRGARQEPAPARAAEPDPSRGAGLHPRARREHPRVGMPRRRVPRQRARV
jgi:hypothetical protein